MDDLDERSERIVQTAISLAEEGGYEAVRLRDVAHIAQVALGTVYSRFRSKEDILVAALTLEVSRMEGRVRSAPLPGSDPAARAESLFRALTEIMLQRPRLSRAVLRAVASGEPTIADKVLRFRSRMVQLIARSLREGSEDPDLTQAEAEELADLLQRLWFASMVGWMGGLHDATESITQLRQTAEVMLLGLRARRMTY